MNGSDGMNIGSAPAVDILLATYNGERFLAEQIDSILAQSHTNWRLLIRDDGSTDDTLAVIGRYRSAYPERVALIEDSDHGLGAAANFGRLMEHTDADYVMFCDQDDVWLPDKTEILLAAINRLESQAGGNAPLLVHSDLRVVGPNLEELHPSFVSFQILNPVFGRSINRLLVQNVVTGCASICNRRLVELARPVPPESMMHDWWIALVAASFGKIAYVPEPTVLYRQHGGNTLGAKQGDWGIALRRALASPIGVASRTRILIEATQRQAAALLAQHGERMCGNDRRFVELYATLSRQGFFSRRISLIRNRFVGSGLRQNLVFLVFM